MYDFKKKKVLITGGTSGIGAATAVMFANLGADVLIIGRSVAKGQLVVEKVKADKALGTLSFLQADFSLMQTVLETAEKITELIPRIDLVVHCVGILISKAEHTPEGIEKDFAVGYLSRFALTNALVEKGTLSTESIVINVAASGPRVPRFARLEFNDLAEVEARVGMQSHGQAQVANDLYSLELSRRFGLSVIGYGPGSVDTNIRRELNPIMVALIKPFFMFSTRKPEDVARQFVEILQKEKLEASHTVFFNKKGKFAPNAYLLDEARREDLWKASTQLLEKALDVERTL
ncbi:MAG: SDR family NAD(P)-dependent oxidoreductase [Chloroflexota bacterium]